MLCCIDLHWSVLYLHNYIDGEKTTDASVKAASSITGLCLFLLAASILLLKESLRWEIIWDYFAHIIWLLVLIANALQLFWHQLVSWFVAASLNNLAYLYKSQGGYTEAEPLFLEALDLLKRLLGDNHPNTKTCRNNLQRLRQQQKPTSLTWWQWIIVIPIVILWMPFYLLWMLTRWLVRRFIR